MVNTLNSLDRFSDTAKEKISSAKKVVGSVVVAAALLSTPEAKATSHQPEAHHAQHEEIYNKGFSRLEDNENKFIASISDAEPEVMKTLLAKYSEEFEKLNLEIAALQKDNDHAIHDEAIRDLKKAQSAIFASFMKDYFDIYGIEQLNDEEYNEIQKDAYFKNIPDGITFSEYVQLKYKESNETLFDIE